MKQQTLTGFGRYAKTTRWAQFLAHMDNTIPWPELAAVAETNVTMQSVKCDLQAEPAGPARENESQCVLEPDLAISLSIMTSFSVVS